MTAGRCSLLLILLPFLTLAGCASAKQSLPLQSGGGNPGFPTGYEVQASLQIFRQTAREHYVLAMTTVGDAFSAIFLTPQGIPVYNVEEVSGRLRVKRHKALDEQVDPLQILAYLELIYREDNDIRDLIRDQWRWDTGAGARRFYRVDASDAPTGEISIRYSLHGPWPPWACLIDERNDKQLTIRILEAVLVLPE